MTLGNIKKNFLFTTWLAALLLIFIQTDAVSQSDPFIPKYNSIKRSERCFTLTEDENDQYGIVWFRDRGDFNRDTTLYFVVYMGSRDDDGADGMAFVMHNDPEDLDATGERGGGLSYADHSSIGGNDKISPSVAIEFDTWNNKDVQDGAAGGGFSQSSDYDKDHTAVVYNGNIHGGGQQLIEDSLGNKARILPVKPWGDENVEDNGCYAYKIEWIVNPDGTQTLELWGEVYNPDETDADNYNYHLVMRHTDDMIDDVFGGETNLRFGFTGSTGGSTNEQTICLLGGNTRPVAEDDFAATNVNTPINIDVETNDQDFDGDNLFVPTIVRAPENGSATVVQVGGANMIEYTPDANFVGNDTIQYRTCDVDSDKCYSLCDLAYAVVTVGCDEIFIGAAEISPYTVCVDTLAPNGASEAFFVSGTTRGNFATQTFDGSGDITWTATSGCNGGSQVGIHNDEFRAEKTICEIVWETDPIDISAVDDVGISIFLEADGNMEDSDYLEVYYVLDGGAEVPLDYGIHKNNFGTATATADGLEGNTLKIVIKAKNSSGDENYLWDDLYITATGPLSPPALTYNWYRGPNFEGTGPVMGGLKDTTYHVFAIDPITGCRSDTVAVTVSNQSKDIPTDSLFIVQEAPFTECDGDFDGQLRGGVIENKDDSVTAGYRFEWRYFDDPGGAPIKFGAVASNLGADDFLLTVTNETTGCVGTIKDSVESKIVPPEIFANVLSHVYSCDDPNTGVAAVRAEVNGAPVTSGIEYYWYEGLIADRSAPEDFSGDTVRILLPNQDYAIVAVDTLTGCPSETETIHIDDIRQNPVPVVTNAADQVSCDPTAPTGAFTAAVNYGGTNITSGFTFNWYKGLNDTNPAKPGYTGGPDVDGLPVDQYRLIVENDTSGCFAILDTVIVEDIVRPVIQSVAKTNVNVCGPAPNGTITITPTITPGPYKYRLYSGSGVDPANLVQETKTNTFTGLAIGDYTVTIIDTVTQCENESPYEEVSIDDAKVYPEATFDIFPQIHCNPSVATDYTGRITATVSPKTVNDYTFEWFETSISGTPVTTTAGTNGEIAEHLDDGTYALRITDIATQCAEEFFPKVNESETPPVIDVANSVASTYCTPVFNGELYATVDGGQTDPGIFTFEWTDVATAALLSSSADVTGVAPGDYSLTVTNDTTTCVTTYPTNITVDDESVDPDPDVAVTQNSACDPMLPNGSIEVTSVPNEPAYTLSDYTYVFINVGSGDTIKTISGSEGQRADSLRKNTYKLVITNTTTACVNEVSKNITDTNLKPVINTVSVLQEALYCSDPYQSRVAVVDVQLIDGSAADTADFDFRWINADLSTTLTEGDALLEDLTAGGDAVPAGNYTVTAVNSSGCESVPVDFEVKDQSTLPTLSLTAHINTSCNPARPNGAIKADPSVGTKDDYSFNWFNVTSNVSIPALQVMDDTLATGLAGADYKVTITDNVTNCSNTFFETINDVPDVAPLLDTLRTKDIEYCIPPDGEIVYQVDNVKALPYDLTTNRRYTFYINNDPGIDSLTYDTRISTDPANLGQDSAVFTGLNYETFYAIVVDEYTHCVSPVVQTELEKVENIELVYSLSKVAGCLGNNGEIKVDASSPLNGGSGFNFNVYYHEKDNSDTTFLSSHLSVSSVNKTGLYSGFYSFDIEDLGSGCETTFFTNLEATDPPIIEVGNKVNSDDCSPGSGEISFTLINQGTGNPNDYRTYLYSGNLPLAANKYDSIQATATDGWDYSNSFTTLKEGEYYLITKSLIDGCFSNDSVLTIEYSGPTPTFSLAATPDITCAGAAQGTGQLVVSGYPDAGYDYTWYTEADTIPGNEIPAHNGLTTATPLFNGMYSIKIEDNDGATGGLGCKYKVNQQVDKEQQKIAITSAPVTDKTFCSSDNGEIYVEMAQEDTNAPFDVSTDADYQYFALFDENMNLLQQTTGGPPYLGGNATNPFINLAAGKYFVSTQNNVTKCIATAYPVEIDDITVDPVISMVLDSADFSCDGANPTGILNAIATGSVTDYSFTWYHGTDTSALAGNQFIPAGTDPRRAEELTAGFPQQDSIYTLVVTDINGSDANLGCVSKLSMRVPYVTGPIAIADAVTNQTICGPNGVIEISQITERTYNYNPDYTLTYDVRLLDEDLNPITDPYATFDPVTGSFTNIPGSKEGTVYYTQAKNIQMGCPYGQVEQIIVKDVSKRPVINISLDKPDYSCNPAATPTGELSAIIAGGSDSDAMQSHFTLTWRDPNGNDITDLANPSFIDSLAVGKYTLEVVDTDGADANCVNNATFDIYHDIQEIIIVDATGTDQTWCRPNGTFQVEGLNIIESGATRFIDATDPEFANYSFSVYAGSLDPSSLFGPSYDEGIPGDPIDSLSADIYFALSVNNGTLCESQPRQVMIKDVTRDPLINLTMSSPNYSLNYDNVNSLTGILEAEAFEADGSTKGAAGFSYNWYRNEVSIDSLFASAAGTNAIQTQPFLRDARYYVEVTSDSTGCVDTTMLNLPFVYLKPKFNPVVTAQTFCNPFNGKIEIPSIRKVQDSTETFDKYEFFWHFGEFDMNNSEYQEYGANGGDSLVNIPANDYYVQALDTFWMVKSDPVQVTVVDNTTYPKINFNASLSDMQTSCNPNTPNGALSVVIGGFDTYDYRWFEGSDTTSAPIGFAPTILDHSAGDYTVKVTSLTTGCISTETFDIVDDIKLPMLAVSSSPVTNCVPENANGIANANIINIANSSYDFFWYEGETAEGTPAYSDLFGTLLDKINSAYADIPAGLYTVVAQDTFDCRSLPVMVEVKENLRYPIIEWNEVSPLTHCDPAKANAVLSATADGKIVGYTFQWHVKDGPLYNEGPVVNNLRDETYRLVVTNNISGCSSFTDVRPTVAYINVPSPIDSIVNHRTSCIMPNGTAMSGIYGNLEEYYFTYLGAKDLDSLTLPRNGVEISGLDINDYYVFATDRTSGCMSDSVMFTIKDERYVPDYSVVAEASSCVEPTGSAEIILGNIMKPFDVRWYDESELAIGWTREILYQPAGTYYVAVEGTEGCIDSTEVHIGTDLVIYNGISANNDGMNDIFRIECFDMFPNNNVKIYNRAGQLVYEINGYDVDDSSRNFGGFSNRGPGSGNDLAVGTYFYVIDKGDGSEPEVGYLELTR